MDRSKLALMALGIVLALGSPASAQRSTTPPKPPRRQLTVYLHEAFNPPVTNSTNGVPCIAEMASSDKKAKFKAGEFLYWLIDGSDCKAYNYTLMQVKFGKGSKVVKYPNGKACMMVTSTTCRIDGDVSNVATEAPDKSRHAYGVTLDGDDTGDPELDIDNGGPAPGPGRTGGGTPTPPPPTPGPTGH